MFLFSTSLHSPLLDNLALGLDIKCTVDGGEAISAPSVDLCIVHPPRIFERHSVQRKPIENPFDRRSHKAIPSHPPDNLKFHAILSYDALSKALPSIVIPVARPGP